jgi:hypothetical protein
MNSKVKPIKRLLLDFYLSEAALVDYVENQPRQQTYIKDLIRKDMAARWQDDLLAALRVLGVSGDVTFRYLADFRIEVKVDDEYFGIWDAVRKTFVD